MHILDGMYLGKKYERKLFYKSKEYQGVKIKFEIGTICTFLEYHEVFKYFYKVKLFKKVVLLLQRKVKPP